MKEIKDAIKSYLLGDAKMVQIATENDGQPWVFTVYYVADDDLNLYWLSLPTRRHSREIAKNGKVAATIVIKADYPVIGLQLEGEADEVNDAETVASVMKKYTAKYGQGKDFYDNFMKGENQHHLYRIKPSLLVLFDEVNFKDIGRAEWRP